MVATDVVPGHEVQVVKADWHPLGERGAHVVVLTSDSVVRMYDVSQDADHSEQTFALHKQGEKEHFPCDLWVFFLEI